LPFGDHTTLYAKPFAELVLHRREGRRQHFAQLGDSEGGDIFWNT
jgi:hypothetical protein